MLTAPQKILVVHVAGLARTTLALPALRALRHALPYSHITVAASTAAADVVRLAACADEVLPVGRLRQAQVLAPRAAYRSLKTVGALRRESYDLAIEFEKSTETGLLLFAAQPAERLRERATSGGKLKRALERVADVLATGIIAPKHAAHRYLDATDAAPRVFTDHAADERFEKRLKKNSLNEGLLVGVHPGAGGGKPRWPLERFADVASRLVHLLDARVLVFAGRQERGLAKQLVGMLPPKRAVALESLPLADAVSALARLSVMVANHAGVAHLAAAVGTPVVAVSPAPSPTPYDLLGAQHRHVRGPHVEAVAADEVYEAACRLVSLSRAELLVTR
jgi:ADP-heptose:LPS heptosyltransferase